jgi:enoyl-[acyl-carrier-protein] reductase (NADH)
MVRVLAVNLASRRTSKIKGVSARPIRALSSAGLQVAEGELDEEGFSIAVSMVLFHLKFQRLDGTPSITK